MRYDDRDDKRYSDPAHTPYWGAHKAKILYLDGRRCRIDRDIAPLIEGLFKLGIRTFSSCQNTCGGYCNLKHPKARRCYRDTKTGKVVWENGRRKTKWCHESVWLCFESCQDGARFLNAVSRPDDSEKLRFQMGEGRAGSRKRPSHDWLWKVVADDINDGRCMDRRGYWIGKRRAPSRKYSFFMVLVMPRAHLSMVTERVLEKASKR